MSEDRENLVELFGDNAEPLANFLTEEEMEVFFELDEEQQQRYLDATASYEAMKAYLDNPNEPEAAKKLLDLSGWK